MALETVNGKVRYHFKVGEGIGMLESDRKIDNGQWHEIMIGRCRILLI